MTLDMEKINELRQESVEIGKLIKEKEKELKVIQDELDNKNKEIQKLIQKGYWWTCDIDDHWKKPKKYSVKKVSCSESGKIYLTIKEVFKKRPWPGFTGEHIYTLEKFLEINISKTDQEAANKYYNRICPKCGGIMKYARTPWCSNCMDERERIEKEFNDASQMFYCPETNRFYKIKYEDELTLKGYGWVGFDGHPFTLQRLDTGEIIHTRNLWSEGFGDNVNNLPEIRFLEEK